jgi:hypothetical protein
MLCRSIRRDGTPCTNKVKPNQLFCGIHKAPDMIGGGDLDKPKSKSRARAKAKAKHKAKARPEPEPRPNAFDLLPEPKSSDLSPKNGDGLTTLAPELKYKIINSLSLKDVLSMRRTSSNNDVSNYILRKRHEKIYLHAPKDVPMKKIIQDLHAVENLKQIISGHLSYNDKPPSTDVDTLYDMSDDDFVHRFINARQLSIHFSYSSDNQEISIDHGPTIYLHDDILYDWLSLFMSSMLHLQDLSVKNRFDNGYGYISGAPMLTSLKVAYIGSRCQKYSRSGVSPDAIPNVTRLHLTSYGDIDKNDSIFPAVTELTIDTLALDFEDTVEYFISRFPNVKIINIGDIHGWRSGEEDLILDELISQTDKTGIILNCTLPEHNRHNVWF